MTPPAGAGEPGVPMRTLLVDARSFVRGVPEEARREVQVIRTEDRFGGATGALFIGAALLVAAALLLAVAIPPLFGRSRRGR